MTVSSITPNATPNARARAPQGAPAAKARATMAGDQMLVAAGKLDGFKDRVDSARDRLPDVDMPDVDMPDVSVPDTVQNRAGRVKNKVGDKVGDAGEFVTDKVTDAGGKATDAVGRAVDKKLEEQFPEYAQAKKYAGWTLKVVKAGVWVADKSRALIPDLRPQKTPETTGEKASYLANATLKSGWSLSIMTGLGTAAGAVGIPSVLGFIPIAGPLALKALPLRWLGAAGAVAGLVIGGGLLQRLTRTSMTSSETTRPLNSASVVASSTLIGGVLGPAIAFATKLPVKAGGLVGLAAGFALPTAYWAKRAWADRGKDQDQPKAKD